MKKVAIVRGPGLSKWEMQIYEPLTKWYEILGIGAKRPINDCSGIKFPTIQLFCPGQYVSWMPKFIPLMFKLTGDTQWLFDFSKAVSNFDLLHAVELRNGYSLQAVRAKREGRVKAVTLTIYENIPYIFDEYPMRRKLKEEVVAGTDHFLAANEQARQALLLEGGEEKRISIVPQSVDTRVFRPCKKSDSKKMEKLRKELKIKKDDFVILSVGRMVWEKGWYDIIPAAAKIKRTKGKVKFLLIGSGPEKENLQRLANRAGLSGTALFPGFLPYRLMPDVFRLANVFLSASLPTRWWNAQFGGVLIEAMATGLPIVGTLCGGTRDDTVGKEGGIFVQPQHFSGLAEALFTFIEDSELRKRIGLRNRKVAVKKYDTQVVAQQIKKIWDKVLEGK